VTCDRVKDRLSGYLDDDLQADDSRAVRLHLDVCGACASRWDALRASVQVLRDLPRLVPPESLAPGILSRLEVEGRGPGLALLFRPAWNARPLILPSLFPAALVFVAALGAAVTLEAVPRFVKGNGWAWLGAESLPPVAEVSAPRSRDAVLADDFMPPGEASLFFETQVAQDGRVAEVTLLDGEVADAGRVFNALLRERFEPALYRGRPVKTSVYRLISRLDVHAPET